MAGKPPVAPTASLIQHLYSVPDFLPPSAVLLTAMVFEWLLRSWLQNAAREKLREKVVEAAHEHMAGPDAENDVTQRPCDVGVVFALGIESAGLEDVMEGLITVRGNQFLVRHGGLKGRHVVLAISGIGAAAAQRATEAVWNGHHPRWILSAGFSGALEPGLDRNHIVVAQSVGDTAGHRIDVDLQSGPIAWKETPSVRIGRLLTVDHILRQPKEKRSLGQQHQALAVDMESYAVAEVCRQSAAHFLAVRVVSDTVDEVLPPDIERLARQKSTAGRFGAALAAALDRPGALKEMLKLKENALVASDRLARFLTSVVVKLVPLEKAEGEKASGREG
jgi:adenosylhomocysteine nucleosidase